MCVCLGARRVSRAAGRGRRLAVRRRRGGVGRRLQGEASRAEKAGRSHRYKGIVCFNGLWCKRVRRPDLVGARVYCCR
jgi:hypothetical protein